MDNPISPGGIGGMFSRFLEKFMPKAPELGAEVKATITVPQDGGYVPYRVACEGTHHSVPEKMELWLVAHSQQILEETGDVYDIFYPQPAPLLKLPGGRWHGVASMGPDAKEHPGGEYDLLLVLTVRSATRQITKYAHEAAARGKWSGMFGLPKGTVIMDSVTLTRA